MGNEMARGKGKGEMAKAGEERVVKAAEWSVRGEDIRRRFYDYFAMLHAEWVELRKARKTELTFKAFVVGRTIEDEKSNHPWLSSEVLLLIGEATEGHVEAWYG